MPSPEANRKILESLKEELASELTTTKRQAAAAAQHAKTEAVSHADKLAERIGVDASTIEANAALRTIIRRDSGEGYREMLTRMAQESGIETPTVEDLVRLDRKRKGKKLSNADWESPTDGQTWRSRPTTRPST